MVDKVAGAARLLATLLAIVAGLVPIGNLNVALVLVILGLVAGLKYRAESMIALFLVVLTLPIVGRALEIIPTIGGKLNAVALNIDLAAASVAATVIAIRLITNSRDDVTSIIASDSAAKPAAA
ncbi:MAG TPA: hypothetical protein VIC34_02565 [Croceibacterium sp.]|jgi:hypothetical protein